MTVRFASTGHKMVEDAALREGVPLAQYVREAALMRVSWEIGLARSGDTFGVSAEDWRGVIHEIREMMDVFDLTNSTSDS